MIEVRDIAKLSLKPGEILVVRMHRTKSEGRIIVPAGSYTSIAQKAKDTLREALDGMGLQKVPVLVMTDDWELMTISALELLDTCVLAEQNKEEADV